MPESMIFSSTKIGLLAAGGVAILLVSLFAVKTLIDGPVQVDIAGGLPCGKGQAQCRRLGVYEVPLPTLGAPAPTPRAFVDTDFSLADAFTVGATHITLPNCTGYAYYAYAHPQNQGPLTRFEIGGINQVHALGPQAPVSFEKVVNSVLVTENLVSCAFFGGHTVRVEP